jgi:hypothetical protein
MLWQVACGHVAAVQAELSNCIRDLDKEAFQGVHVQTYEPWGSQVERRPEIHVHWHVTECEHGYAACVMLCGCMGEENVWARKGASTEAK